MWKWEASDQPKAVIVLVHSAYEHHRRYAWLIQRLRNDGFHVVTGDLPGHGKETAVHSESFKVYRRFIKQLIQTGLEDHLPVFLFGHGLGATFLLRLLQTEQVECAGVICTSPWLHLDHHPPLLAKMLTKLSSSMKLNHEMRPSVLSRNPAFIKQYEEDPLYTPLVTAEWYRELQLLMKSVVQMDSVIQNVPLLLHTGEADKVTDPAYSRKWVLSQNLNELQYKVWKELEHDVVQEPEREEVYLYTRSFMDNVLRSLGYVIE